jgi:hypothetical protein
LKVFRKFTQTRPLPSKSSTAERILLFFDLARLVIAVEELIKNRLMTESN